MSTGEFPDTSQLQKTKQEGQSMTWSGGLWQLSQVGLLCAILALNRPLSGAGLCTWSPHAGQAPVPKLPGTLGIKCSELCQGPARPSGQALDDRTGWEPCLQMTPVNSSVSESSP